MRFWAALLLIVMPSAGLAKGKEFRTPADKALALFNAYLPKIEKRHPGEVVDGVQTVSGDLDGDGYDDVIVSFVMLQKSGGNAIVGGGKAIYLQKKGGVMKVVGEFPDEPCGMHVEKIVDGKIHVQGLECMAPYMKVEWEQDWVWKKGKVVPFGEKKILK